MAGFDTGRPGSARGGAAQIAGLGLRALVAAAGLVVGAEALACGPSLPVSLLFDASTVYLRGPRGDLGLELRRIGVRAPDGLRHQAAPTAAVEAELAAQVMASPAAVVAYRAALDRWVEADPDRPRDYYERKPPPRGPPPALPADLPEDWRRYHEAAALYHAHKVDRAVDGWREMLSAPGVPARSPLRLWAHYMLGRVNPTDPMGFAALHAAIAAGAPDPLGLGAAALGWQAREAIVDRPAEALRLYLQQLDAGDVGAEASVRDVAHSLLEAAEAQQPGAAERLAAVAADPIAAAAVTATLVTALDPVAHGPGWIDALSAVGGEAAAGAERVAWAAYQAGRDEAAARWAKSAPGSPVARWILARVALRAGRLDEAEALFAEVAMPPDEIWRADWHSRGAQRLGFEFDPELSPAQQVWAERAALALHRGDHRAALEGARAAEHWVDLAHISERVADIDVVKAFVDEGGLNPNDEPQQPELRALLGRRLFRAGREAEAVAYLSPEVAAQVTAYRAARARGTVAGEVEAARLLRRHGMEMSGTALAPDWEMEGGAYAFAWGRPAPDEDVGPIPVTDDERARIAASAPVPDARFHYRYRAAELMWQATQSLPDQDPLASALLCEAGSWLSIRDPEAADRYYKATVTRSWGSPLSVAADQLRWFPYGAMCSGAVAPELPLNPRPAGAKGPTRGCGGGGAAGLGGLGLLGLGALARRRRSGGALRTKTITQS